MNFIIDWLIYLFIHILVIYSRYHKGPWDIEQVKDMSVTIHIEQ